MNIFWLIQTSLISLIIICLSHYIYVYLIDNFTEVKIKDPEIIHSNFSEIINTSNNNNKVVHFKDTTLFEDSRHDRNMEEELKIYLQQQMNQQQLN